MSNVQLAINEMDVSLNTGKAVAQCIVQGTVVFIVVVRMGLGQRCETGGSKISSTRAGKQD